MFIRISAAFWIGVAVASSLFTLHAVTVRLCLTSGLAAAVAYSWIKLDK